MYFKIISGLLVLSFVTSCQFDASHPYYQAVGKNIRSTEAQKILNQFDEPPETMRFDETYYYIYKQSGVDIRIDSEDTIKAFFLYGEGTDGHRQYMGDLPYSLKFTDTRKDIELKLGPPDKNGGSTTLSYRSSWDKLGISVTYKYADPGRMDNVVAHLVLDSPELSE